MRLPPFVQSPLLLREAPHAWHVFPGRDPVPDREPADLLRAVFSIPPGSLGTLRQTHSAVVREMEAGDGGRPAGGIREGDALFTGRRGTGVGVRTADCVPVLLAHRELPLAVAVHAGWRGLAAGILGEAVRALAGRFGEDAVAGLVAAVGPCARGCCYEVGEDVAEGLHALPGAGGALRKGGPAGKWTADLAPLALAQLVRAGLDRGRAEVLGPCTVCDRRFHSYRREKSLTGRQLSLIYIP